MNQFTVELIYSFLFLNLNYSQSCYFVYKNHIELIFGVGPVKYLKTILKKLINGFIL